MKCLQFISAVTETNYPHFWRLLWAVEVCYEIESKVEKYQHWLVLWISVIFKDQISHPIIKTHTHAPLKSDIRLTSYLFYKEELTTTSLDLSV